jgi:hypothetical protein
MTTLKQAIKENKLKDFIAERSKEELKGDKEKFDKTLKSITSQKKSKAPQASTRGNS